MWAVGSGITGHWYLNQSPFKQDKGLPDTHLKSYFWIPMQRIKIAKDNSKLFPKINARLQIFKNYRKIF